MTDRGLFWSDPNDEDKGEVFVCGPFKILAETRDENGWSWGVLTSWEDHDGRQREFAVARAMLASDGAEIRRVFLDGGLPVGASMKARNLLTTFLTGVRTDQRARSVSSTGWHASSYVLPDGAIGQGNRERTILQTTGAIDHAYNLKGDLVSWQEEVAKYAVGNSRLLLAISTAFAAALIGPCGAESGGIHLRGRSSIGKSTALHVAGSVYGGGDRGYVRPWRATSNGLEAVATSHNDALLCLDELAQLSGREAGEVAYMLANGSGKSRASREASLRRSASWRTLFLSSGEISLADKIAEDGRARRQTAGQQVRVVDVPAHTGSPYGLFEELHGFDEPGELAKHLVAAARAHYGHAARAFINEIAADLDHVRAAVTESICAFVQDYVPAGADGQVSRVANRFALIGAAGEIAAELGIVPWPTGEPLRGAKICFDAWLQARGGVEPAEVRDGIDAVKSFLSAHGTSRFLPAWEADADQMRIPNLAGYRRRVGDSVEYFVTSQAWAEVAVGFDPKNLATALADRNLLLTPPTGPHRAKMIRVPGHGNRRLYHISPDLLEDPNA